MRALYRVRASKDFQTDLSIVEDAMLSPVFIYLDFLFLSFIFSYILYPLHQSFVYAILIFLVFNVFCAGIFYMVHKWTDEKFH